MVWNNVIVFRTFTFDWKSVRCFQLVISMDRPNFIYLINKYLLTMGVHIFLLLCLIQGSSCAVQSYSELLYPVPRHKLRNLGNAAPELTAANFKCSEVSISHWFNFLKKEVFFLLISDQGECFEIYWRLKFA